MVPPISPPSRRHLPTALCFVLFALSCGQSSAEPAKPNIIYLLADDLGYGDLGSYGQKLIHTPRLDGMAREGIRLTQHYAGAPSCHPSRCVLFTGKHTGHSFIRGNSKIALRPDDYTLPQMLNEGGYVTGGIGKWALGDHDTTGAPWLKGMDEFFGYLDQTHAHAYYPDHFWKNGKRFEIPENADGKREVYSHDLFTDFALDFIRRHKDKPFFFYGAFTIPHAEVTVPDDSLAEYLDKWPEPKAFPGSKTYCPQDKPRAHRAGMITRLDRDIGRLLDLLDELGIAENTLVILTSDNGPATAGGQDPGFFDSNGPLRDLKFTLYEGGIRVPCLAQWKGKIAPGTVSDHVSDFADMVPTLAEATGIEVPAAFGRRDGVSILPALLGQTEGQAERDVFYWEAAPQQALRRGDWKAYRPAPGKPIQLYDLAVDVAESRDLAAVQLEIVASLEELMSESRVDSFEFPLISKMKKPKNP